MSDKRKSVIVAMILLLGLELIVGVKFSQLENRQPIIDPVTRLNAETQYFNFDYWHGEYQFGGKNLSGLSTALNVVEVEQDKPGDTVIKSLESMQWFGETYIRGVIAVKHDDGKVHLTQVLFLNPGQLSIVQQNIKHSPDLVDDEGNFLDDRLEELATRYVDKRRIEPLVNGDLYDVLTYPVDKDDSSYIAGVEELVNGVYVEK